MSLAGRHRYWAELRRYLETKLLAICLAIFALDSSGAGCKFLFVFLNIAHYSMTLLKTIEL